MNFTPSPAMDLDAHAPAAASQDAPDSPRITHHSVRRELVADPGALLTVFLGPEQAGLAVPQPTAAAAARVVNRAGQRELQRFFKEVYTTPTFSNNNGWLRRKLYDGAEAGRRVGRKKVAWGVR